MFRNTNHAGNRRRSHSNESGEEDKLFSTDATILDTLQGIAEHITTNRMNRKECTYMSAM